MPVVSGARVAGRRPVWGSSIKLVTLLAAYCLALSLAPQLFQLQTAEAAYQWPFSSSSSSTSSSSTTTTTTTTTSTGNQIRLRSNRLRRPELCRESLPRKSEELPVLVITGRVREVYLAGDQQQQQQPSYTITTDHDQLHSASNGPVTANRALVTVNRVIRGNQQLLGSDIVVSGFNSTSSTPCPNYVKPNDTLILLLDQESDRRYTIQGGNLLPMNLANLDRVNAIAADEPHKRRGPIEDILCEAKYCAYGRCVVVNEAVGEVACKCPDSCPNLPEPVCGSDNTTYTNECHLIKEGCARQRPLFVTKTSSC
uniref:Agrin n=1 Tax=Aceria tosichella TaxID=561515 RepID=A0A6G1S6W8_9ACAR